MTYMTSVNVMLDADAVINNSSEKVGGSNAYPDAAPEKWVSPDPEKHTGSTPPLPLVLTLQRVLTLLHVRLSAGLNGVVGLMSHVGQLGRVVTLLLSALLTLCTPPLLILLHKHDVIDKPEVHTHRDTHSFIDPLSGTTQMSRYQKGKTSVDFIGARDSEWQWHQLGHMQVCTSLQTDNHASTPPLTFYRPDALPATQPTASKH